jgi:hypothetical protein
MFSVMAVTILVLSAHMDRARLSQCCSLCHFTVCLVDT